MQCSDTSGKMPVVRVDLPMDVAEYVAHWLKSIKLKPFSGNSDLTLHARGGNIEAYSTSTNDRRQRKKAS